ncbi:phosphoribosylamine--glycine ligase [Pelagibius sp. Alg239-R121]|uniref:phosphoribosylamine--glycine ligase n=1 Tax=Pelagibius sp. Alg239-R121 TaxID=2993448 RepID=UPI0024A7899A|nr:phosphoribosylamine--glycine ligase [Pelagibius sp. Alg239-R121]
MKVLVIGSGGREHALCWSLAKSPLCSELYCAPGNAGIASVATCVAIGADDLEAIANYCGENKIDFVVVGPEGPLVLGLVDRLTALGVKTFGPSAAAAALEGSKGFMKDICAKYGIPTAAYGRFRDPASAKDFIRTQGAPIVVKTDGLAAGKGVIIAETIEEAEQAVDAAMTDAVFGEAGAELVIEEFMTGEEASFFVLTDGVSALALASAQDHKRVGEGDTGLNTGGMGAYSPAPVLTAEMEQRVLEEIVQPTIDGLHSEGKPFRGVLFAGLMLTAEGPKLIEYNVRFGDPECQVLMLRLQSDLLPALIAACDGNIDQVKLQWHDETALTVVMAAQGYPGSYAKGDAIGGLSAAGSEEGVVVFHAGTKIGEDGAVLANGGRVLNVTAKAPAIAAAQGRAYAAVDRIDWPGGFCRRDIGWREIKRG